jgi:phage terminase small subunit
MARRKAAPAKPDPPPKPAKAKKKARKPPEEPEPEEAACFLPGLTYRQSKFVLAFVGVADGNATKAARVAGYAFPNVEGSKNLVIPSIRAAIAAKAASVAMSADEVLARLSDQAALDVGEFFRLDARGQPVLDLKRAKAAGKMPLVRSIKPTRNGLAVEFHDPQAALEKLGRYHGLFKDRAEAAAPDAWSAGAAPAAVRAAVDQAAREIDEWKRAGSSGWDLNAQPPPPGPEPEPGQPPPGGAGSSP